MALNLMIYCSLQRDDGDEELCSVYVPTNHLYIGDIFLVNSKDVIRPNLSIREGIGLLSVSLSCLFIFCVCLVQKIHGETGKQQSFLHSEY